MSRKRTSPPSTPGSDDEILPVFRSRLGRRLVVLFVGCALIPILAIAVVSRDAVSTRLREDADESLHEQTRAVGTALAERLLRLERDLEIVGMAAATDRDARLPDRVSARVAEAFRSIAILELDGGRERVLATLFGKPEASPPLSPEEIEHLRTGRSLVRPLDAGIELSLLVDWNGARRLVRGPLIHDALFNAFGVRPPVGILHVLTKSGEPLHSSSEPVGPENLRLFLGAEGPMEWTAANGDAYVGRVWRLFLEHRHRINWLIVHGRPKAEVLAPIEGAETLLVLVAALTALTVLALSLVQIRRTLDPIGKLIRGTRAIQAGHLEVKVGLDRDDEFGDLGDSFDEMVSALRVAIDRREQTERELRTARDRALDAARAQASFVTNVSHEFRTPVACMLASAEILRDFSDGDPEACREFSDAIVQDARHLTRLVEDTLALSGGDETSASLPTEPVDIGTVLAEAVALRHGSDLARISVECADGLPAIDGEPRQILRLFDRLIDNALKFSDADSSVRTRAFVESDGSHDSLIVEVEDFGEGIAEKDQSRIFDRFVQVGRNERTNKAEGTGVGLSLARRIADRHGAKISLRSSPGHGSTFRVAFPLDGSPVTRECAS